jgi:hypothetical protein
VNVRRLIALLGLSLLASAVACDVWADAPAVSVTWPSQGAVVDQALMPAIVLQASATGPDDTISSVTFLVCRSPCASWSGGERQRTAISDALVASPAQRRPE